MLGQNKTFIILDQETIIPILTNIDLETGKTYKLEIEVKIVEPCLFGHRGVVCKSTLVSSGMESNGYENNN